MGTRKVAVARLRAQISLLSNDSGFFSEISLIISGGQNINVPIIL
jgi:hypothetical protein